MPTEARLAGSTAVVVAKPVNKQIVEWQYFTAQTQAVDRV
jgi:hypothetical protein